MCTVTWVHEEGGYRLLSNRDERRGRRAALPPSVRERDGVQFAAPVDGDFGGTWIGVNERGVSLCLLNGAGGCGVRSRGLLVADLVSARSLAEAAERFRRLDLSLYAPFTLLVLAPGRDTVLEWSGRARGEGRVPPPLASSSLDLAGVRERRRAEFRAHTGPLESFHASHADGPSAYSPCMHRADAETVSLTRVRVTQWQVELFYTPAAPCRGVPGQTVFLRRTA
jgi:hypothetical protein